MGQLSVQREGHQQQAFPGPVQPALLEHGPVLVVAQLDPSQPLRDARQVLTIGVVTGENVPARGICTVGLHFEVVLELPPLTPAYVSEFDRNQTVPVLLTKQRQVFAQEAFCRLRVQKPF